jgi:hypothetical protein
MPLSTPPDPAREREQVAEQPDEVRDDEHRSRGRSAERVEARPQDRDVEAPVGDRRQERKIPAPQVAPRQADALRGGRGYRREPGLEPVQPPLSLNPPPEASLDVGRGQGQHSGTGQQDHPDRRRHRGQRGRRGAGEEPEVQSEPADDHRRHVDEIGEHEERDGAVGDDPRGHPGTSQRPRGHRQAAGTARGQQPCGRETRHGDLVALANPMRRAEGSSGRT